MKIVSAFLLVVCLCGWAVYADVPIAIYNTERIILPPVSVPHTKYSTQREFPLSLRVVIIEIVGVNISSSSNKGSHSFAIERSLEEVSIEDAEFYPEEHESTAQGMTALVCPKFVLSSIVPKHKSTLQPFLVPLNELYNEFVYDVVATLYTAENSLRFGIIVENTMKDRTTEYLSHVNFSECGVKFLPKNEQISKFPGQYRSKSGKVLSGLMPLQLSESEFSKSHDKALKYVIEGSCKNSQDVDIVLKDHPKYNDHDAELARSFVGVPVTSLVEIPNFGSIAKGMMGGIATPMIEPVSGAMASGAGSTLGSEMGATIEAGLGDVIPLTLGRLLSPAVARQLVPAMAEVVNDQLPPKVSENLKIYCVGMLTKRITDAVTQRLDMTLTPEISEKVDAKVPLEISTEESKVLGLILTRSISHSVVPALVHTITHSPLQDYFCYYCSTKEEYCEYCNFSPIQNYYAMYYTGWWSTWMAHYYTSFFTEILEQEESVEGRFEEERYELQQQGQDIATGRTEDLVVEPISQRNFPGGEDYPQAQDPPADESES